MHSCKMYTVSFFAERLDSLEEVYWKDDSSVLLKGRFTLTLSPGGIACIMPQ